MKRAIWGIGFLLLLLLQGLQAVQAEPLENPKIIINVPSRTLTLLEGEQVVKTYPVGVGRKAFPTPVGQFSVIHLYKNPGWENPYKSKGAQRIAAGKRNPLGTRWIGFKEYKGGEYGIHGTDSPKSVGQFSSHGCVRMNIKDAEAVYDAVKIGTPVEVTYNLVTLHEKGSQLIAQRHPDMYGKGFPHPEQLKAQILETYPHAALKDTALLQAVTPNSGSRFQQIASLQPIGQKVETSTVLQDTSTVKNSQPAGIIAVPALTTP